MVRAEPLEHAWSLSELEEDAGAESTGGPEHPQPGNLASVDAYPPQELAGLNVRRTDPSRPL
jgi:hypothetical protein